MQKQKRLLIGDVGNAFATICADHLRRNGVWATTCPQGTGELRAAIRREHPDVILLSADNVYADYTQFITEIRKLYNIQVTMLVSVENEYLEHAVRNSGYDCLMMPSEMRELASILSKHFHLSTRGGEDRPSELDLEVEITNLLYGFGIPANLRGFHYLRRAILTAYASSDGGVMMANIYPVVAERFQSTVGRVERAIRHAITQAWNLPEADRVFSYHKLPAMKKSKPTNSELIAFVVDRLKLQYTNGTSVAAD